MSTERVVVITGTSSGIGLHCAVLAARAGWSVVATMRDPGRADGLLSAAADAGSSSTCARSTSRPRVPRTS